MGARWKPKNRTSKYHAQKYGNYDSKKEYRRAQALKVYEKQGVISDLQEQVSYELVPTQYEQVGETARGKPIMRCVERAVKYIADFVYKDKDGNEIVEDTKGMRTPEYIIKRKLMLYLKGIKIREI